MRAIFALILGWGLSVGWAFAQTPPPAEAYGRLPAVFDAAISPDGTKAILALTSPDGTQAVRVINLSDGAVVADARVPRSPDVTRQSILRGVGWADDRHYTFTLSATFRSSRVMRSMFYTPGASRLDFWRTGIGDLTTGANTTCKATPGTHGPSPIWPL